MNRFVFLLSLAGLTAAGCQGDGISVYDIPKEKPRPHQPAPPPMKMPMPMGGAEAGGDEAAGGAELAWTTPKGWVAKGASGMRLASFEVGGADGSVTAFPGPAGGDLPNVNRWRGQVGLEPFDEDGLAKAATRVASAAGKVLVVDFTGEAKGKPVRLLGGVIQFGGKSWFFKLMGDGPAVGAAKPAFLELVKSLHAK
jgi:hypothetical protein